MKLEFYVVRLKWNLVRLQNSLIVFFFLLFISAHCYNKVKAETTQMQEKIESELGLNPVEEEVVVLYDGEKGNMVNSLITNFDLVGTYLTV